MRALLSALAISLCLIAHSASAHADDASHRLAVRELFKITNMEGVMNESMATMLKAQVQMNPSLAPVQGTVKQFLTKYMSWQALEPEFITIYMRTFTEPELHELVAFYKTAVGKKAVQEMPKLFQQGAQVGAQRVQQHMPELMQALQDQAGNESAPTPKRAPR